MDGTVATGDSEPCVLGVMPRGFADAAGASPMAPMPAADGASRVMPMATDGAAPVTAMATASGAASGPRPARSRRAILPGMLLRFALGPGGFVLHAGRPVGADLRYLGPVPARRGRADLLSKALFQHMARTAPLELAALLQAAGEG